MRMPLCEEESGDMRRVAVRRGKCSKRNGFFKNTYEEGPV
jgi:hypothetical protein